MIHRLANILIVLTCGLLFGSIIGHLVPWFDVESPMLIQGDPFFQPGDKVPVKIHRRSLLNLRGHLWRELVRVEWVSGMKEEYIISRMSTEIDIEKGHKNLVIYFQLPTMHECPQMKSNTYIFRGSVAYKPFGLWRKLERFNTEEFHIESERNIHGNTD